MMRYIALRCALAGAVFWFAGCESLTQPPPASASLHAAKEGTRCSPIFTDDLLEEAGLAVAWRRCLDCGPVLHVYLDAKNVYVETKQGLLICVNARTGETRWRRPLHRELAFPPMLMGDKVGYECKGYLCVLDLRTGRQLARVRLRAEAPVAAPVYCKGAVYMALATSRLVKLDAKTGESKWRIDKAKQFRTIWAKPACIGKYVVYVSRDKEGSVHCVKQSTGDTMWEYAVGEDLVHPVAAGNLALLSCADGNLYAFDVNAKPPVKPKWVFPAAGPLFDAPQTLRGLALVTCRQQGLYAIDLKTGRLRWLARGVEGKLLARGPSGRLYVGTYDGFLTALDEKTGKRLFELEPARFTRFLPNTGDRIFLAGDAGGLLVLKERLKR